MRNKVFGQWSLILDLARNDFKTKYAGSFLGVAWAFVQPVITVVVYWIVFQYGLKIGMENSDVPYIMWFMTGMVPWFFFSDCLGNGSGCLKEYNYLVKKVLFPIHILPLVKLVSAFMVHLVFLGFLMILSTIYNLFFTIDLIQLLYFSWCLLLFNGIWIFFSSSVVVFFKDFSQIISIILQIGMWATPILWDYHRIPDNYLWIMKCNPLFYIIEGYRSAFLGGNGIYPSTFSFGIFWIETLVMAGVTAYLFSKSKPHFADIL